MATSVSKLSARRVASIENAQLWLVSLTWSPVTGLASTDGRMARARQVVQAAQVLLHGGF